MSGSFIDSNVLLYLGANDPFKARRARSLLEQGDGVINVQVVKEFTNVCLRKLQRPWDEIDDLLGLVRSLARVLPLTVSACDDGLRLARRHRLSIWDAMIVASALEAEADVLWSEDMQTGLVIRDRLRISNPFAH
ncbi:MAG TPA: PIN domain-containing protein [Caulobacteraceae bacterium]|jgi:predicted nucleic acid-binding protein